MNKKYGGSTGNNNDQYSENVSVFALSPLNPIYLENGNLYYIFQEGAYYNNANPVAISKLNLNRNNSFRGLSSLYGEVTVLKGVALKTIFGFDYMQNEGKEKTDPRLTDASLRFVSGGTGGRIEEGSTRQTNIISTNTARYAHSFGMKHNLSVMLGQEARILNKKLLTVGVTGITSPYYDQITSPGAQVYNYSGNVLKETLLSYFGQTSYDYNNKYFLTATIRRDGSSRFGKDERFGTYWSIGSGYIVSSEKFLAGLKKWLSYLKIRGSIGEAGNAGAIDRFTPYDRMTPTIYGGSTAVQTASSQSGNADVRWEKNVSWNIGLDLRLIGDRLIFTGDKYTRTTYDLIYQLPLPQTTGFKTILTNIGTMKNEGLELNVSGDIIRTKDFSWRISANWSKNTNKLVKASDDLVQSQSGYLAYNQVGQSFNSFYLKRWAGVDPATGLAQWVDSTGKPNSNYNAAKQEFVGKSQPDGFGSVITNFNYKGFELSAMFYYQYGNQLYNTTNLVTDGLLPYINESTQALNRWQKPGDQAPNPKRILGNPTGGSATFSTRNLFDGDHIRFQNLSLTYQFSPAIIKILHLSSLKVYAQGNNLKIWTKGSSYSDPSSANVYGGLYFSYPIQKSYSIGLNLGF